MKIYEIARRNITRNKRRSFLSILATAIATMVIVLLFSFIGGMKNDLSKNISSYFVGHIRVRHKDFDKYETLNPLHLAVDNYAKITEELKKVPGVLNVSPRITFPQVFDKDGDKIRSIGIGVDFSTEKDFMYLQDVLKEGELPKPGENGAVIGYALAEKLGVSIGDKITSMTMTKSRGANGFTLKVSGIASFPVSSLNNTHFLLPIAKADRFLRMGGSSTKTRTSRPP